MTAAALDARDIAVAFGGIPAVDGVDLTLAEGAMTALIGPNGAGKTTLFDVLAGRRRPDRGRITLRGRAWTRRSPPEAFNRGIGRTFQLATAFRSFTALEAVQLGLASHRRLHFLPSLARVAPDRALALLDQVGLADRALVDCAALAYGEVKRLELALALANEPWLLLLDEPAAGLDMGDRRDLFALIDRLRADRRLTVLFTEHDIDLVFGHAERVVVLDKGRIIADGAPEVVRGDPAVRAAYLTDGAG